MHHWVKSKIPLIKGFVLCFLARLFNLSTNPVNGKANNGNHGSALI